jgi:hypothetical protein
MSYAIKLEPEAQSALSQMPRPIAFFVAKQLELLAQHPTALSRPSHFPYLPNRQIYSFDADFEPGKRHFFNVMFRYGADEQSIWILQIAMQVADSWWGKEGDAPS